jgi:sestrin
VQDGDVDNLIRVMSFHPDFLNEFMNLYNYLMYSQHGALPYDSRHFIAIMAATRHKCIYLVKQQEREFLLQNGQKAWIHGINYIPQKLKDLYELNKLLCHQPWLINQTHIEVTILGIFLSIAFIFSSSRVQLIRESERERKMRAIRIIRS